MPALGKALTGEGEIQHQRMALLARAVEPGAALGQPLGRVGLALQRHHAAHQPDIAHGLALGQHGVLVDGPASGLAHVGLQGLGQGVDALQGIHQQLQAAQLGQQAFGPVGALAHQRHRVGQALAQAGGLGIHHAGGHRLGLVGAAVVGRQAGQPLAQHIGQPQAQLGSPGLHALPAFEFAFFSLLGGLGGNGRIDRGCLGRLHSFGLGFFFLGPLAPRSQPLAHPGGLGRGEAAGILRLQQQQRQAVLARKFAAGARTLEAGATARHIHLRLVGLAAAALALAPHRIVRGPQRGPLGRRQQALGRLAAGLVGRQHQHLRGGQRRAAHAPPPVRRRCGWACPMCRCFGVCL